MRIARALAYPGPELIPGAQRSATVAVTIEAPPDRVWPWLVQMGADRAGSYSWDQLDNWGIASAERIHPEWQDWVMQTRQFAELKRRAERYPDVADRTPAA
jgi:hypothetical protein